MMRKEILFSIIIILFSVIAPNEQAYAKIDDVKATKAIIGESASEPASMSYIAHAIRNRGTLRGVYGLTNNYVKYATPRDWQLASKAWHESEYLPDPTGGADHWHAVEKEGKVYWQDDCKATVKSGSHTFFKCPW